MVLDRFDEIWMVDFEFRAPDGHRPHVVCMVAEELRTGKRIECWEEELRRLSRCPFNIGRDAVVIAYYASAEVLCFMSLGWELPIHIIDLYPEFRNLTNGKRLPCGRGLVGALVYYGLNALRADDKDKMRALVLEGCTYTAEQKSAILEYCSSDVDALKRLLKPMGSQLTDCSLIRGRYMKAAAFFEWTGIPIDHDLYDSLQANWSNIQRSLIMEIDRDSQIYEHRTFKRERFASWLAENGIPWPRLESGQLDLSDEVFRQQSKLYPAVAPIRELRYTLSKLRNLSLPIGPDHRSRCLLSAFSSLTGRNQPSTSRCIFGSSVWLRGLVRPEPGRVLIYFDWAQQEFGIAALLSKDPAMIQAYQSGDPYMELARMCGAAPAWATKASHPEVRAVFKQTMLAVQYCMGASRLAMNLGVSDMEAKHLLGLHKRTFSRFWRWSDAAFDCISLHGVMRTRYDWRLHLSHTTRAGTVRNFPMQANGAEMMRCASILAGEKGLEVCWPVHDAFLVDAPISHLDDTLVEMSDAMAKASEFVLDGFRLESEHKVITYPNRFMDERGVAMWNTVNKLLARITPGVDAMGPIVV